MKKWGEKIMTRVQFMCYIFILFTHLFKKSFPPPRGRFILQNLPPWIPV